MAGQEEPDLSKPGLSQAFTPIATSFQYSSDRPRSYDTNMRSPFTLLTLLVLALLATSAVAWKPISKGDADACKKKSKDAAQAIGAFCQRFPMMAPSRDIRIGRYSKNTKIFAKIMAGSCKPAEKVPKEWCFKQFYNICRWGAPNGTGMGKYGGGGCQSWQLFQKGWNRAG